MSDWNTDSIGFESSDRATVMVKPPFPLAIGTWFVAVVSCLFFFGDKTISAIGYALTVIASIAGGITALTDQKRRGNSNYVAFDSFRWVLISVRYFVVFTAIVHIVRLAINAANGGWRLF